MVDIAGHRMMQLMDKDGVTLIPLLGMDREELGVLAEAEGSRSFRGNQLADWLYRHQATDFDQMTNLPASLRDSLRRDYTVGRSRVVERQHSIDGTIKLLLELADGVRVETVGLPHEGRYSCCVSTQAGCTVGCRFCATGQSGFQRNLTAGEMVDQVLSINQFLAEKPVSGRDKVDHIIMMGMGEPLLNYSATVKALRLMSAEMGISPRRLTVSTIGHVTGINRLSREQLPVTLAISLHAPDDRLRKTLIPGFTRWKITEIIEAGRRYVAQTGRRLTFEYCLLDGVNDSVPHARALSSLLSGLNCHVNIIPFNPAEGLPYRSSSPRRTRDFIGVLAAARIQVTERVRRGADIDAACGQLRRRGV